MEHARRFEEPDEVDQRLGELGLRRGWLEEAVRQGELQRRLATPLDPAPAAGFSAWARTVRIVRELLILEGWHASDAGQISAVVDADETVVLMVSSGDHRTGRSDDGEDPKTKNVKGEATARVVRANAAPELDLGFDVDEVGPTWWVLLIHSSAEGVFAELSSPSELTAQGHIAGWGERIILGRIDLGDDSRADAGEPVAPAPPADVAVTRRSS